MSFGQQIRFPPNYLQQFELVKNFFFQLRIYWKEAVSGPGPSPWRHEEIRPGGWRHQGGLQVTDSWQWQTVDSDRQLTVTDSWQWQKVDSDRQLTVTDSWQWQTVDRDRQLTVTDSLQWQKVDSDRQLTDKDRTGNCRHVTNALNPWIVQGQHHSLTQGEIQGQNDQNSRTNSDWLLIIQIIF